MIDRVVRVALGVMAGLLLLTPIPSGAQAPDQIGQWGPVLDWGVQGKHMVLQPTGRVLVWSTGDNARLWNPATGTFTLTPATFGDLHCGAQATLADGRTIAVGGVEVTPHVGIKITALFDPFSATWTQGAEMHNGRWYATATTLPDGRVFASSGDDHMSDRVLLPEVYDPVTNVWTLLTGGSRSQLLYPFMYVLPSGTLFEAGTRNTTAFFDLAGNGGTGSWSNGPTNSFGSNGYSECGAMYAPGKILRTGGGDPSFANTAVIDMNASAPAWRDVAPMAFPRRRHNVVILADGSLIAVGGTRRSDVEGEAILAAEIWSPLSEQWRTVAAMTEARMYHSAALLLPDGRVLTAGGEATGRQHAQIYSPPYLFKGPRPQIASAPDSAAYGDSFPVATPDAAAIAGVALIRPSAVTHAIDMNQRYVPLAFSAQDNVLSVTAPASGNLAPPGYYLLVIQNASGVPSVAAWLRLDSSGSLAPGTISGLVTEAGSGAPLAEVSVSYSGGSTRTGDDGAYELAGVAPGEHLISAAKGGYATVAHPARATAGAALGLDFALAAPGGVVGRVSDAASGIEVSGATVGSSGQTVLTDDSGDFALAGLAAGPVSVSAAATGYHSAEQTLTIASGAFGPADFALAPLEPTILGEVLDARTEQPIVGASVSYPGGATQTDALGRYQFTGVVPGTHAVTAEATGYRRAVQLAVVTPRAWTTQDFGLAPETGDRFTFPAVADGLVLSSNLNVSYGSRTNLRARAGTPEYRSFVKFDVAGVNGAILGAKLRLYVTDASSDSGSLYYVGNTWTESSLTWSNAPALDAAPLAAGGDAPVDSWVEYDVSSVVTGNGTYAFGLASASTNSVLLSSREGAHPPELVVEGSAVPGVVVPNLTGFEPASGPVGSEVVITGANFEELVSVTFNGVHTTQFTVDSPTQLRATVPAGGSSGPVSVINTAGMAVSALPFSVGEAGVETRYFAPTDDAQVLSTQRDANYGGVGTLRARDDTSDYRFFLKFTVAGVGGAVRSARIRLFVTDASPSGGAVYRVANRFVDASAPWSEATLTWANAPVLRSTPLSQVGAASIGRWVEFDVTPVVTGNGSYSFAVASASIDSVYYSSKEGTNPPVLVIETAGAP